MDLEHFKTKLLAEKENLQKEISSYRKKDPYFDTNRLAESFDDDISEMEGHDRTVGTESELGTRLEEVDAALGRLDSGTYGKCENCGGEINPERLEAMPTATLCSSCQEKHKVT